MPQSIGHKLGFGVLNLLFLGISIGAGVTLVRQSQEIRSEAAQVPSVYIDLDATEIAIGDRVAAVVRLNSGQTPVGYVDVELKYNPRMVQAVRIEPGTYFDDVQIDRLTYDNGTGTAIITLQPKTGTVLSAGDGVLAIAVFEALESGGTNISVPDPNVALNIDAPSFIESVVPSNLTITE